MLLGGNVTGRILMEVLVADDRAISNTSGCSSADLAEGVLAASVAPCTGRNFVRAEVVVGTESNAGPSVEERSRRFRGTEVVIAGRPSLDRVVGAGVRSAHLTERSLVVPSVQRSLRGRHAGLVEPLPGAEPEDPLRRLWRGEVLETRAPALGRKVIGRITAHLTEPLAARAVRGHARAVRGHRGPPVRVGGRDNARSDGKCVVTRRRAGLPSRCGTGCARLHRARTRRRNRRGTAGT